MSPSPVVVVALIRALPGREAAAEAALRALIAPTRAEAGCRRYELHRATTDAADFVFLEEWASAADLERHSQSAHLLAFRAQATGLLAAPPDVRTYDLLA